MRARHRVGKLLLRQGIVWSGPHHAWLASLRFERPAVQAAYEACYDAVLMAEGRRARLDASIAAVARDPEWFPVVSRLVSTSREKWLCL